MDVDPHACVLARRNAQAAGVAATVRNAPVAQSIRDDDRFPLVLADPPYIPSGETARFPRDPVLAIDGGDDGMAAMRECLAVIATCLAPQGAAIVQCRGPDQAAALAALAATHRLRADATRVVDAERALVVLRP